MRSEPIPQRSRRFALALANGCPLLKAMNCHKVSQRSDAERPRSRLPRRRNLQQNSPDRGKEKMRGSDKRRANASSELRPFCVHNLRQCNLLCSLRLRIGRAKSIGGWRQPNPLASSSLFTGCIFIRACCSGTLFCSHDSRRESNGQAQFRQESVGTGRPSRTAVFNSKTIV